MKNCTDNWTGKDKFLHFVICLSISIFNPLLTICVAICKEIYDNNKQNNHFCFKDLFYDIMGIIIGTIIHCLIIYII